MTEIPLEKWFGIGGLTVISFPVEAEYVVLNQIRKGLGDELLALIHSKLIDNESEQMTLIDATGHEPTARTALRQRVGDYDNDFKLENPADVQGVLSRIGKLAETIQANWWLWWSPSDMIAQGVTDEEVARCMRIIAKDFSKVRFLAFIARDVHTHRGLATLKYISTTFVDVTRIVKDGHIVHNW
ncbi:MAG: hypothetical protein ACTSWA_04080, partial [Candidatus Thorarchaeota archaeon]